MEINWIEINLPFTYHSYEYIEYPIFPVLTDREIEVFGQSCEDSKKYLLSLIDQADNDLISENEIAYYAIKHKEFNDKLDVWYEEQPEIKKYYEKYDAFVELQKQRSFSGLGLARPGTLIELEDGTIELLGSTNCSAGVCNDCLGFETDSIIKRYAVVFDYDAIKK